MDMSTLTPGFLLLFGSICLGKSIEETKLVMNRATKSTPAIELKSPTSQPRRAVQLRSEEPSSSATAVITSWGLGHPGIFYAQDLLQNNQGAAFFDPQIKNYTQMVILPQQSVVYAIANGVTVLKLDMTTYFLLDSYTIPQPDHLHPSCQDPSTCREATELSLLALMPNKQMIWFCYVHYLQHLSRPPQHIHTGCMVPQVDDLSEPLLQWENAHFSSLDPHQPVEILNAKDQFTYIAGVTMDYLRIFRTHMPDWDGKVNWTQALVTDKGENHIAVWRISTTFTVTE